MNNPTDFNPDHILKEADAFMYVYNQAMRQASGFMFQDDSLAILITGAAFVNHAYALELYLKCILCIEGTRIEQGHSIPEIYRKVTEDTKLIIEDDYQKNVTYLEGYFDRHGHEKKVDFKSIISQIPNAFVGLRYIYENPPKKGNERYELECISPSVRNTILKLKPGLKGYL